MPYDAVLWHPDYAGWLARWIGVSWEAYIAEVVTDRRILFAVRSIGLVYLATAIMSLTAKRTSLLQLCFLVLASALLGVTAFCKYVESGYALATLVEHGGQVLSPVVLVGALRRGAADRWTIGIAVVAFWATFAGHGVYAIGLAPTPGHFYGLVHAILGFGAEASETLLRTAGLLDFIVCFGILVPWLRRGCLLYAALWGLLTALARPVAGMSIDATVWGADQFLHEALVRFPHACLPLFLWRNAKR